MRMGDNRPSFYTPNWLKLDPLVGQTDLFQAVTFT